MNPALRVGRWEQTRVVALHGEWGEVDELLGLAARYASHPRELWIDRARFATWRDDPAHVEQLRADLEGQRVRDRDAEAMWMARGLLEVHAGHRSADLLLDALTHFADQTGTSPHRARFCLEIVAEVAAGVGRIQRALAAIEALAKLELGGALWLARCPLLDRLRTLPRFRKAAAIAEHHKECLLDAVWSS